MTYYQSSRRYYPDHEEPAWWRDAFGRVRVSTPETIFDSKQLADNAPLVWSDALVSGSGGASTYNSNQASTTLSVSASTACVRARQTFRWMNYQPGKSQLIFMTTVLGAGAAGITRRVGQFNADNGVFFELNGTTLSVARRTKTSGAAVDTAVAQADWNLDRLDGTGPSRLTLDTSKTQILVFDYEWLGVGSVRYGFVINGALVYVHQMVHANSLALVYMSSPNLPLRYEITNSGAGAAAGLVHICATVISEGGKQDTGFPFGVDRDVTPLVTLNNNALYPLLAVRLRSGYFHATVSPEALSVICTSTSAYRWMLLMNPTVVGTALSYATVTDSAIEAAVGATNATTVTGGTLLRSGYGQAQQTGETNADLGRDLRLGSSLAGVADQLVLAVQRISGTTETFYGSLNWREDK